MVSAAREQDRRAVAKRCNIIIGLKDSPPPSLKGGSEMRTRGVIFRVNVKC